MSGPPDGQVENDDKDGQGVHGGQGFLVAGHGGLSLSVAFAGNEEAGAEAPDADEVQAADFFDAHAVAP
jgi:hypothetical protein